MKQNFNYKKDKSYEKATLHSRNPSFQPVQFWLCNFAAFEDLIANIQSGYNEEKRLKNAAFEFMINKGIYVDFHEWLHNPARQPQSENIRGRFRLGAAATTRIAKFFGR